MNTTIEKNETTIACLPFLIVTAPSVGLMTTWLIGVLLSVAGRLPAFRMLTTKSTSFSVIEPPLIWP